MKKIRLSFAMFAGAAVMCAAQTTDRTKPPVSPDPRPYKLPAILESKLPNGLAIMMAEDSRVPLVTVRLVFPGGNRRDPKDMPGLAASTASMLTQGTKTRTYQQIAEQLDTIGAAMTAAAGADQITIQGSVLSEKLPALLELMADVARNASFPENELALHKQNRKQQLAMQHADPSFLATETFRKATYQEHPYAHVGPTSESLDKMEQKTLAGFRDTFLVPNNATLILVGTLPGKAAVTKSITTLFGSWEQKDLPKYDPGPVPEAKKQLILVNRPGSVQADITIGRTAAVRRDADYFPEVVGSVILGSGTNSRLFLDIREKRGYAYDAHTELNPLDNSASITAVTQIRNEVAGEGIAAVIEHLDNMGKTPVSSEELRNAKSFANGMFLMRLEPQSGLADQLVTMRVQNLPRDYLETYTTKVNSVEPEQIQRVAKKYFSSENATVVVVGDAEKLEKPLEKLGKFTVVKP
ncbi:MAG: insulinase family protein, partial [Bryobacterales bacterium]|nr:insulinase family protein [Bryobacterales bacterium]